MQASDTANIVGRSSRADLFRKIVYCLWLTTGIFVIVASLLRCILSMRSASEVDVSTIWAIRETVRSANQSF